MKCDELIRWQDKDLTEYYEADSVDAAITELKDKCNMHNFFWEGCGFAKRGFKNTITVSEAFDRLEAENAELKNKLMPCLNGDCILTCEVVEKYGKENAELKQKLENVQASAYADSVDSGMRERRLRRALWLARAERYKMIEFIAREEGNLSNQMSWSRILRDRTYNQWVDQLLRIANLANKLQNKCRAKAEEYK